MTVDDIAMKQCNEVCSICLDTIEQNDVLGVSHTHCGHVFHTMCLQRHMGQAVIDAKVGERQCLITEDHHGFHCPNCRERLYEDMSSKTRPLAQHLWYSSPPSQVAFDALLNMYTQKFAAQQRDRRDEKFRFVQTTGEKARTKAHFSIVLKAQQEAQQKFSAVDRMNPRDVYYAYHRLSVTTAQMLHLYLQCSGWSTEHYKPLLKSQLHKYGLNVAAVSLL